MEKNEHFDEPEALFLHNSFFLHRSFTGVVWEAAFSFKFHIMAQLWKMLILCGIFKHDVLLQSQRVFIEILRYVLIQVWSPRQPQEDSCLHSEVWRG